jgi:hypothetical protein
VNLGTSGGEKQENSQQQKRAHDATPPSGDPPSDQRQVYPRLVPARS